MSMFPILLLPSVALREVLKHSTLMDLFLLSLCSKRSKNLVKWNYNRLWKWKMSIHSQDILRINCLFPGIPGRLAIGVREIKCVKYKIEGMEQLKIGGHKVPYERENDSFYVYCEDRRSVFTALYCHIHEIFNVNPDYLYIEPPFLWILNLSSRTTARLIIDQDKVDKVSISEEECKYVLKNCKTQDLLIYVDFPRHFRYFGSFGNYKKVYIRDGSWVMLENLISIGRSSTHIKMENTILTTKDINSFLKYWYSQTVNRFRRLTLNNDTNHLSSLFDGLEHTMRMVDGTMLHECDGYTLKLDSGFRVIQRKDGMVATVGFDPHYKKLTIFVWNNIESIRENEMDA